MDNTFALRTHKEMKEVLMKPDAPGPDAHYYMIRGGSARGNITIWQSGEVGGEYIKAYGHYHIDDFIETYEVLLGEGVLLLQGRKTGADGTPLDDELEYAKAIFVKRGSVVAVPKYAGHLLVNTGSSWLITRDDSPVHLEKHQEASWPAHADYGPIKKMQGFAYYVVNNDGRPSFMKNPNYKNVPDLIIEHV